MLRFSDAPSRTIARLYSVCHGIRNVHPGVAAQDLKHLYMIAYQPPSNTAAAKWHKIELSVEGLKDYRIRAKEGYFPE